MHKPIALGESSTRKCNRLLADPSFNLARLTHKLPNNNANWKIEALMKGGSMQGLFASAGPRDYGRAAAAAAAAAAVVASAAPRAARVQVVEVLQLSILCLRCRAVLYESDPRSLWAARCVPGGCGRTKTAT